MRHRPCFVSFLREGKRVKIRKRTIAITAGTLVAAGALVTGCVPETVYGPPPEPSFQVEDNIPVALYGPPPEYDPAFSPENNIPEDVYGPPMPFEEESEMPEDGLIGEEETQGYENN